MAKPNKKKILVACVTLVLVVSAFTVNALATSIYPSDDSDFYLARMPIKDITIKSPYDYGITGISSLSVNLTDSLDGKLDIQPFDTKTDNGEYAYLKFGTYINYPIQYDDYTNAGRLVTLGVAGATADSLSNSGFGYYDNIEGSTQNLIYQFALNEETTVGTPTSTLGRNLLNGNWIEIHFNDFLANDEMNAIFSTAFFMYSPNAVPEDVSSVLYYTYVYKTTSNTIKRLQVARTYTFSYTSVGDGLYYCVINTDNAFPIPDDCATDDVIIRDCYLIYQPYGHYATPTGDRRIIQTYITNTVDVVDDREYYRSSPLIDYFEENPLERWRVDSIADADLLGWLETAVGGFFDFEFVPNVTLGGLLLLCISVGVVMLLIRIFRG